MHVELPTVQNWSCHNCSGCCRQHLIDITEAERDRILSQGWSEADDFSGPGTGVVSEGLLSKRHRLAHTEDGACVFLREDGLCRIHAKFGEEAKPLACRVYPYAPHPSKRGVTMSLRFSCPTVVANGGAPVAEQTRELNRIAKLVTSGKQVKTAPPSMTARDGVDWSDVERTRDVLRDLLTDESRPFLDRLFRAVAFVRLLDECRFETVRGERLVELFDLLLPAIETEAIYPDAPPTRTGSMLFRLLLAQYARKDTGAVFSTGFGNRLKLLVAATKFASGLGLVPVLQEGFRSVPFSSLDGEFGWPEEADELWTRYFTVKLEGLHFCGPAFYDLSLTDGFLALSLMVPVTLALARWRAAGEERSTITFDDVADALTRSDHHHGYSPALGSGNAKKRLRTLKQTGDIPRLIHAWSR